MASPPESVPRRSFPGGGANSARWRRVTTCSFASGGRADIVAGLAGDEDAVSAVLFGTEECCVGTIQKRRISCNQRIGHTKAARHTELHAAARGKLALHFSAKPVGKPRGADAGGSLQEHH